METSIIITATPAASAPPATTSAFSAARGKNDRWAAGFVFIRRTGSACEREIYEVGIGDLAGDVIDNKTLVAVMVAW